MAISWRASFVFQAIIIVVIVLLGCGLVDPVPAILARPFDTVRAVLSAVGLVVLVGEIRPPPEPAPDGWPARRCSVILHRWRCRTPPPGSRTGKEVLLSTSLFRNRTSNLALVTQNVQWAVLLGSSFVVSVYLQTVRHYNAIQTGVIFTAATVGILLSSLAAGRLVQRFQAGRDHGRVRDHHHWHHRADRSR